LGAHAKSLKLFKLVMPGFMPGIHGFFKESQGGWKPSARRLTPSTYFSSIRLLQSDNLGT
jgi:hypothetical protein